MDEATTQAIHMVDQLNYGAFSSTPAYILSRKKVKKAIQEKNTLPIKNRGEIWGNKFYLEGGP